MVHIIDATLDPWILISGWAITITLLAYTLSKMEIDDVPKLSVITAAVFVVSLIHFKIGPTSVHFILNGFAGVILGTLAYPCIFVAVLMQFYLFTHGGETTIGINTVNMGVPALVSYLIFRTGMNLNIRIKRKEVLFGAIAGGIAVVPAVLLSSGELLLSGEAFTDVAAANILAHIPVAIIEAIFTGVAVGFLATVKPEMLGYRK